MIHIKLTYLGFDKGGNPQLLKELSREDRNPNKDPDWFPCLWNDDEYLGPIWFRNERGKLKPMTAKQLAHMHNFSSNREQQIVELVRNQCSTRDVPMYLPLSGPARWELVPKLSSFLVDDTYLTDIEFGT